MDVRAKPATILVVDKDVTVRMLLGRLLARLGHTVLEAGDPARALRLAEEYRPQLAVVDLCLGDGDGVDLAGQLHDRAGGVPLILITGYPPRLHEDPALSRPFLRLLAKPFDVTELRLAVHAALTEGAMPQPKPSPVPVSAPVVATPSANARQPVPAPQPTHARGEGLRSTVVVLAALAVLVGFVAYVTGVLPGMSAAQEPAARKAAAPKIDLVPGSPHTVSIPEDVRESLGIRKGGADRLATAREPAEARPLFLSGSTALDPTRLFRIRVRFTPAEATEIGEVGEVGYGPTTFRELRSGDVVHAGQRLALFYSIDVGNKKNDVVDALVQLKLDQEILDASRNAFNKGALSALDLLAAKRAVQGDYNAINRAENTLRAWAIPESDIETLYKEAEEIIKEGDKRDRSPEHLKQQLKKWARVEVKVPEEADGGTIVERNLSVRDVVVDNTLNLLQIAKVDRLLVLANAPEEDLPRLHRLGHVRRRWTVRTAGAPDGLDGRIDDIGYIIDPAQHSAVVKGHIANEGGLLRGGQYVTATVKLPPPPDVVEVPNSALADDGKQAGVFVQAGDKPGVYTFRRVEVVQRFDDSAFVRSRFPDGKDERPLTPEEKDQGLLPRQALKPGEKVITAGVLELKKELEDRESAGPGK